MNELLFLVVNNNRMKGKKNKEHNEAVKELDQSTHLIRAPDALQQDLMLVPQKIKVKVSQSQAENAPMEE